MKIKLFAIVIGVVFLFGLAGCAAGETATTNGTVSTKDIANTISKLTQSGTDTVITEEQAKVAALSDAGLAEPDVTFIRVELNWEGGKQIYEVEFYSGNMEYDYEVDAVTGTILKVDYDVEDYSLPQDSSSAANNENSTTTSDVGEASAKTIALAHAGLSESELKYIHVHTDWEEGRKVYEVEFCKENTEYDYEIDAATGEVVSFHSETHSTTAQSSGNYIGESHAKAIALEQVSGATESNTTIKMDYGHDVAVYEGEIKYNGWEYEFEIRATDGVILEWDVDYND